MGRAEQYARNIVLGTSVIFMILGIVVMILAITAVAKGTAAEGKSKEIAQELKIVTIAFVILATSIVTILMSIIGLIGALKKKKVLLVIYSLLIFLAIGVQLAMGSWLHTQGSSQIKKKFDDNEGTAAGEAYQEYMKCCGWENAQDAVTCPNDPTRTVPGCKAATDAFINKYIRPVAAVAIAVAVLELIGLVASCVVIFKSGGEKEDFYESPFHY